jgi:serine/threonine protein kinase
MPPKKCPLCGAELPEAGLEGLCPRCVVRQVAAAGPDSGASDSPILHCAGDWDPGQEVLDEFVVERTLGEGGMGKVYLVRSRSTGSQFAVKRAKGLKAADRRNFVSELQTWIDLPDHVNLVPCRFFRTLGNEVLIFAEYVEGGSLKEWLTRGSSTKGAHSRRWSEYWMWPSSLPGACTACMSWGWFIRT